MFPSRWRSLVATALTAFSLGLHSWVGSAGAVSPGPVVQVPDLEAKDRHGSFTLDGNFIHDAGELQLNLTNWGLLGSQPSSLAPYSDAPSAMWPAGSGVDYLYAAGYWIGGIRNGVPLVSTGQFQNEFMPSADPLDTIYESSDEAEEGGRYPFETGDDDEDGSVDEDPLNGRDDDGDGAIDEDYAAISNQYFRFTMRDDLPLARELYPDHEPLGIEITQESMQWENLRLEDSIGFDVRIRNVGDDEISGLAFGIFADGDVGRRSGVSISQDDMAGYYEGSVVASDGSIVPVSLAYFYDCDGDGGDAPGYLGFSMLGVKLIPAPREAPFPTRIESLRVFAGRSPYERGGDPTSDAERYDTMTGGIQTNLPSGCNDANDYRFVVSVQPTVGRLRPGEEVGVAWALSAGETLEDLVQNAGEINQAYLGQWYDFDGDPVSGQRGRERYVCASDFGEVTPSNPLFRMQQDCGFCEDPIPGLGCRPIDIQDLDKNQCIWINDDCEYEAIRGALGQCWLDYGLPSQEEVPGCTGVRGKEHHEYWIAESPIPPPSMRTWERDGRVHLFWDDEPENHVDRDYGRNDFESYKIWRADDWSRPAGTSIETGPGTDQWSLVNEFDVVDRYAELTPPTSPGLPTRVEWLPLGRNTGLEGVRYTPLSLREGTEEHERFAALRDLVQRILAENPHLPRDVSLRFLDEQGEPTEWGERYPELADWRCCEAEIDTIAWAGQGKQFYEYVDREVTNGFYYFYSVTVATVRYGVIPNQSEPVVLGWGPVGQPQRSFRYSVPQSRAQSADDRRTKGQDVYVVPNPVTRAALAEFQPLDPNADDPTGVRLEFRNLPEAVSRVSVYTLSGDLVVTLSHDGRDGSGSLPWNLVSRKGQEIVSGVYLFTVETEDPAFEDVIGRFVVVR